jgi:hypothetical protein
MDKVLDLVNQSFNSIDFGALFRGKEAGVEHTVA